MVFEFRVWGLFLLFFLICFYFLGNNDKRRNSSFSNVLIGSYFLEFFYILYYIVHKNAFFDKLFLKSYYFCFCLVALFICYYFVTFFLKEQYKTDEKIFSHKLLFVKKIFYVVGVLALGVILFTNGKEFVWNFVFGFSAFSTFVQVVLLLFHGKVLDKKSYQLFVGFVFLECLFFIFANAFPNIEIMQSAMILLTVYLYILLENNDKKRVEVLQLERDYAMKNLLQKETFLKKLSHEIRIPIHTIDGFSQIMEDARDVSEIKEEVKDIRLASSELLDSINSMIDLSILESGKLEILPENYNIYDTLEDFSNMIPSRLKSKDIVFKSKIDKDIPEVLKGDSDRIRQILLNVISNSIKYTEKGSIRLEVSSVKSNSLCRLSFKVIDTGKGMTQDEIHRLLDKDSDERGIGLRVAYYLLELMNGKLDIQSVVGKGTTVSFSIDQEIIALKQENKEKKEKNIQIVSFKGKKILLVDDNKLNLKVAEKLLLPYDVEVISVSSGNECLDILDKDTSFDLILMDDLMPNLSGTETLDILRKIERVSGYYIPVVALTANATPGMKEKYLSSGFDDYLAKPIQRIELDEVLKKYLKK